MNDRIRSAVRSRTSPPARRWISNAGFFAANMPNVVALMACLRMNVSISVSSFSVLLMVGDDNWGLPRAQAVFGLSTARIEKCWPLPILVVDVFKIPNYGLSHHPGAETHGHVPQTEAGSVGVVLKTGRLL